jgi:hypothetical protein
VGKHLQKFMKFIHDWFKPKYNELTTFLMALTCILLFMTHPDFRDIYSKIIFGTSLWGDDNAWFVFVLLGLISLAGLVLSLISVFTKRQKSSYEKTCIGIFMLVTNAMAGIVSGIEMFSSQASVFIVFPIINIASGIILIFQIGLEDFEVTDKKASLWGSLSAGVFLLYIFSACYYIFHFTWALTFSFCMLYSSTIIYLAGRIIEHYHWNPFTTE